MHTRSFAYCLWLLFCGEAEQSSCDKTLWPSKLKIFTIYTLTEKYPALEKNLSISVHQSLGSVNKPATCYNWLFTLQLTVLCCFFRENLPCHYTWGNSPKGLVLVIVAYTVVQNWGISCGHTKWWPQTSEFWHFKISLATIFFFSKGAVFGQKQCRGFGVVLESN